ncbi:hypothetical protein AAG906_035581 [Vitis piasezkii]
MNPLPYIRQAYSSCAKKKKRLLSETHELRGTLMHLLWEIGHFVEKCYQLQISFRHPKARTSSNFNRHKNTFDTGLLGVTPIDTPMERGLKLSDKRDLLKDLSHCRRFMYQPRKLHMEVALRVVRFLKNAPGQGLFFSSNYDFRLRAYSDSDWAGCLVTRRFMNSAHQLVDVLTKALGKEVFTLMIHKLGIQDIHSPT